MGSSRNNGLSRRGFVALCLSVAGVVGTCGLPRAVFGMSAAQHNGMLRQALLGSRSVGAQGDASMKLLECASYLCLDQTNHSGQDKLDVLSEAKVPNLPRSVDEIDFSAGSEHRQYTHKGWDYEYSNDDDTAGVSAERRDKANWPVRKRILCETVEHVFSLERLPDLLQFLDTGCTKECDANARYIYTVHILGDYIQTLTDYISHLNGKGGIKGVSCDMMDFANPTFDIDAVPDVFSELQNCAEVLFKETGGRLYASFENELCVMAKDVRYFSAGNPWRRDLGPEAAQEYLDFANELNDLVISRVPDLYEKNDYFREAFP